MGIPVQGFQFRLVVRGSACTAGTTEPTMVIEARDIMPHRATDRLAERMEGIIADLAGVESISVGEIALFLAVPNLNWAGYSLRDPLMNKKVTRPPVETKIKKDLFNGT